MIKTIASLVSFPDAPASGRRGRGVAVAAMLALVPVAACAGCQWFDSGPIDAGDGSEDGDDADLGPCTPTGPEVCDGIDNDCDGAVDEDFDLDSDPTNCGECGIPCSTFHNEGTCDGGLCVMACEFGWTDANGNPYDGCEYECVPEASMELLDRSCNDGIDNDCDDRIDLDDPDCNDCVPEFCNSEDDDCDALVDEDYNLNRDPLNCGLCGHICPPRPHARGDCARGECGIVCEAGWEDTNGLIGDGCEGPCAPDPTVSESACDGLDNDCDGEEDEDYEPTQCGVGPCMVYSLCEGGLESCTPLEPPLPLDTVCNDIDDDCDGATDEDGDCTCETAADCDDENDCTTDTCRPDNRCLSSQAPDGTTCGGGQCCGGMCVDTQTSPTDCGGCGNVCGPNSQCTGGACVCTGSFLNCDDSWINGCEANPDSDPDNCGECDNRCGANASCSSSACVCDSGYVDCNLIQADGCEILETECNADCGWTDGQDLDGADLVVTNGQVLSGRYKRINIFRVPAGVTGLVAPYNGSSGGTVEICARQIIIEGTLTGTGAGYLGGCGGSGVSCTGPGAPGDAGGGTFGGTGGTGGASSSLGTGTAGTVGGFGGYAAAGANGDTTRDESLRMGSGGGGGGGGGASYGPDCLGYGVSSGGGGGAGGTGGGAIKLYASVSIQVSGTVACMGEYGGNGTNGQAVNPTTNCTSPCTFGGAGGDPDVVLASTGGSGGGTATAVGRGGAGGGGGGASGGGILLKAPSVTVTGTMNTLGSDGTAAHGGTIKIFYQFLEFSGTTQHGRLYQTPY